MALVWDTYYYPSRRDVEVACEQDVPVGSRHGGHRVTAGHKHVQLESMKSHYCISFAGNIV